MSRETSLAEGRAGPEMLAKVVTKLMRELGNAVEIQPSLRALVDYEECQRITREALNLCRGGEDGE